jgi:hypothetical protein
MGGPVFQKNIMAERNVQIRDEFLKSRDGAILRCASIMVDSGRKDLAKQILSTTHIDKNRIIEIKNQNI